MVWLFSQGHTAITKVKWHKQLLIWPTRVAEDINECHHNCQTRTYISLLNLLDINTPLDTTLLHLV